MKALVYNGPGQRSWHEVPDPVIQDPEDAIVRVDAVTICGTDLHILKLPDNVSNEEAVLLADILPTPYEVGVLNGKVSPGDTVVIVGVHGAPATLHLEDLWIKDVTITTGLVDTVSTPRLLSMLAAGRLQLPGLITHRFGLDEMQDAYDVFSDPASTGALEVALFGDAGVQ
ncbi:hypothetical protein [Kribbella sp. NPDC048928]|uniref:hypothetical protein n=1 Tax=Kribbella sp. NPDC048928 TaxID=3364111 RepID=UPI003722C453